MKKGIFIILLIFYSSTNFLRAQEMTISYDVQALSQGNEHTAIFKVFSYGKTAEEALERAKMDAVYAVIFSGVPGTNSKDAFINDKNILDQKSDYFKIFFGVDELEYRTRSKKKIRYGEEQAPYRKYVSLITDGTIDPNDRMKAGKEYRVGAPFSVKFHELRVQLENDGIIRKLGLETKNSKPKKPTIMVEPDDDWCQAKGYMMSYPDQGSIKYCADYEKALQNETDLNNVITQIGGMFLDRGFPLKDLKASLDKIANDNARKNMLNVSSNPLDILDQTAKADIKLKITWKVVKQGPYRQVTFTIKAIDPYTSKQIGGVTGTGEQSSTPEIAILLKEAVLSHVDNLQSQMQKYFDDLLVNGREVSMTILKKGGSQIDLDDMYDFLTEWMDNNTVNGSYSKLSSSDDQIQYEQIRIPLFKKIEGNEKAIDTERFFRELGKAIKEKYNYSVQFGMKGLGDVWLTLSET